MGAPRRIEYDDFTVCIEPDHIDGGFTAWIPEMPGVVSDGATEDEAHVHVLEALVGAREARQ